MQNTKNRIRNLLLLFVALVVMGGVFSYLKIIHIGAWVNIILGLLFLIEVIVFGLFVWSLIAYFNKK